MKNVLIICEYNPFHNGHAYQIKKTKELFPDARVICLMSPNFVQRGESAVFHKYTRANAALLGGADLVLSLPFVFSTLSAEGFCEAGVQIGKALGVDALVFGAEDSDERLCEIAAVQSTDTFSKEVEVLCKKEPSLSLQEAGELLIREKLGTEYSALVKKPNNILAIEYIKAIKKTKAPITPVSIKRVGEGYKSLSDSQLPSATLIRQKICANEDFKEGVPEKIRALYEKSINSGSFSVPEKYESFLRCSLLSKSRDELISLFKNRELASRLYKSLRECESFEDAIIKAATSRITHTRIKRAALSAAFGISHNRFMHDTPSFVQVLAMNPRGREFLSCQRKNDSIVILTKSADYVKYGGEKFKEQFLYEIRADEIWASIANAPLSPNCFMKISPIISDEVNK